MWGRALRRKLREIDRMRRGERPPPRPGSSRPAPPRGLAPGAGGACLRFDLAPADLDGRFARLAVRLGRALPARGDVPGSTPAFQRFVRSDPQGFVYIDIETAGLSSSAPLFLVGTLWLEGDRLRVRQYFARDYSEEAPVLRAVARDLARFDGVVTFNGKSFDLPFLRDRCVLARIDLAAPPLHVDLLHEARRRFRGRLPDCRLGTLEAFLCARRRAGDLPGAEIPGVYHEFVRTGEADLIELVFRHNALDLAAMAEVAAALVEVATQQRCEPGEE